MCVLLQFIVELVFSESSLVITRVSVNVILERHGVLVPSGLALGDAHGDEVSEPENVVDFHLLEAEVTVEDSEVEAVLEGHGESAGHLALADIVELVVSLKGLVVVVGVEVGVLDEVVRSVFKRFDKLFGVSAFVDGSHEVGVKVTQVSDELSSLRLAATGASEVLDLERVVDNLDSSHVAFELEEVIHACGGGLVKVGLAPLVEVLQPDLFNA